MHLGFQLKIELVRCYLELLKIFNPELVKMTVNCLISMCESVDGIDAQSSKLRRLSASALVNLTNTAPEVMLQFFDLIYSTAQKWDNSRLHVAARVLLFEVMVMLCWLPDKRPLLPKVLSELLTAASNFLSQVRILI